MISFEKVEKASDLSQIELLAAVIWKEHYTPIIGEKQVAYMLKKFQSVEAMQEQIKNGYSYYSIIHTGIPVGYLSFEKRRERLFLSKLYLLEKFRGKGLGKEAMEFVNYKAVQLGCSKVSLTVNKFNVAGIRAYTSGGFANKGPLVQDIGQGFIMDDYLMERELS